MKEWSGFVGGGGLGLKKKARAGDTLTYFVIKVSFASRKAETSYFMF